MDLSPNVVGIYVGGSKHSRASERWCGLWISPPTRGMSPPLGLDFPSPGVEKKLSAQTAPSRAELIDEPRAEGGAVPRGRGEDSVGVRCFFCFHKTNQKGGTPEK